MVARDAPSYGVTRRMFSFAFSGVFRLSETQIQWLGHTILGGENTYANHFNQPTTLHQFLI